MPNGLEGKLGELLGKLSTIQPGLKSVEDTTIAQGRELENVDTRLGTVEASHQGFKKEMRDRVEKMKEAIDTRLESGNQKFYQIETQTDDHETRVSDLETDAKEKKKHWRDTVWDLIKLILAAVLGFAGAMWAKYF